MSQARGHFEGFADHTLLKHAFIGSYLVQWASILLSERAGHTEVCFIDCFGGPGHDGKGQEGSPLIAARTAVAIARMSELGKLPPGRVLRIVAVEQQKKYCDELRISVQELLGLDPSRVLVVHADYRDALESIVSFRGSSPCLTFLDPFGVSGLDASVFPAFLAGDKSELLLLVSGMGAARLSGVLSADGHQYDVELEAAEASPTLFPEMQEETAARIRHRREEYIEALDSTKPGAREVLFRALGNDEAVERILKSNSAERPMAFVKAIAELLRKAGALYVVLIPMRDEHGSPKYTLMHASKSPRAVSAMKEAVSTGLNREELSKEMRERIRRDLTVPTGAYVDWLKAVLAGSSEYWAWGRKQRRKRSLQEILVETTALFPFQVVDVKKELRRRGYLTRRDNREWVQFP